MQTLHFSTHDHECWDGPKRWFRVFIHETVEELQTAARRYSPHIEWKNAYGCFHPVPLRERHVDGKWENASNSHFAGVIRLWAGDVNAHVVSHEIVHAAAAVYRMDVRPVVSLGRECGIPEEDFAYIVGDLTASLAVVLHDAKAWSTYKEDADGTTGP